ncbi:MAG: hypothetical protein ACRDD7_08280 [Peptostreptococcaceae bacterium]
MNRLKLNEVKMLVSKYDCMIDRAAISINEVDKEMYNLEAKHLKRQISDIIEGDYFLENLYNKYKAS